VLDDVGLGEAAARPVGHCSHGMQKRLSVARALLAKPRVLLVDEATHDLDPEGALRIRALVRDCADAGTAVLCTTQRLDEVQNFARTTTLLVRGTSSSVAHPRSSSHGPPAERYVVDVRGVATARAGSGPAGDRSARDG
jgi:ABC-type multidrug transport system ATPase subunit